MSQVAWMPMATVTMLLVIATVLLVFAFIGRRFAASLRTAGDRLGLTWRPGAPFAAGELVGSLDGQRVSVFVARRGVGSFGRVLSVVEIELTPPLRGDFHAGHENVITRLFHRLGRHDAEFDDPVFDDVFRVSGADDDLLARVFHREARALLVRFAEGASDVHVTPARLRWEYAGRVMDPDVIERVVRAGVAAAGEMRRLAA